MTADIVPFPRQRESSLPSGSLLSGDNSAALDVLAERLRLFDARAAGIALPMPVGERARAVRWAADMILQIESLDACAPL